VVPPGRARGELTAFDQDDAQPAQHQIVGGASAGRATTHDRHVRVVSRGHVAVPPASSRASILGRRGRQNIRGSPPAARGTPFAACGPLRMHDQPEAEVAALESLRTDGDVASVRRSSPLVRAALGGPQCLLGAARYRAAAHTASAAQPREDGPIERPGRDRRSKTDAPVRPDRFSKYRPRPTLRTHPFGSGPKQRQTTVRLSTLTRTVARAGKPRFYTGPKRPNVVFSWRWGVRHAALCGDTLVREVQ
jgi:hypothetical protein